MEDSLLRVISGVGKPLGLNDWKPSGYRKAAKGHGHREGHVLLPYTSQRGSVSRGRRGRADAVESA